MRKIAALVALMLLSLVPQVLYASAPQGQAGATHTSVLEPEPGSEVVLDRVEIITSDGMRTVRGEVARSSPAGMGALGYRLIVNIEKGTYRTVRVPVPNSASGQTPVAADRNLTASGDAISINTSGSTRFAWVVVNTVDPVGEILNRTRNKIEWVTNADGSLTATGWYTECWAASPSSLGTHWYVASCVNGSPVYGPGRTDVTHDSDAAYYNYDFQLDTTRTDVWHWIRLRGYAAGGYWYTFSYSDAGEGADLLTYEVYEGSGVY